MKFDMPRLAFGERDAANIRSEQALVTLLQKSVRPVADAAFSTRPKQLSKTAHTKIGNVALTATVCSPIHFETFSDPQCCIFIPLAGIGRITTKTKTMKFSAGQILRLSFSSSISLDYERFSGISIKPDISELMLAMKIPQRYQAMVAEQLLNGVDGTLSQESNGVNYYNILSSIASLIDSTDIDEIYLHQIGIDALITNTIAQILLTAEPEIARLSEIDKNSLVSSH